MPSTSTTTALAPVAHPSDEAATPKRSGALRRLATALAVLCAAVVGSVGLAAGPAAEPVAAAPNGCSYSPDRIPGLFDFKAACDRHDICYSGANGVSRSTCDSRFRTDMRSHCTNRHGAGWTRNRCLDAAQTYYQAVRTFGGSFWGGPPRLND